mmetsp:Transcript_1358/g.4599  ORF Transcript_1358/g.4599 Transcript_1358/m.4599 type:complete len:330 (+) Transcript_1358:259-1248(+)
MRACASTCARATAASAGSAVPAARVRHRAKRTVPGPTRTPRVLTRCLTTSGGGAAAGSARLARGGPAPRRRLPPRLHTPSGARMGGTSSSMAAIGVKEIAPGHFCADQSAAAVKEIACHLPWYGPKYSPHDVPSFYDISGITESPAVFQSVVDILVERYRAAGAKGPTHIAGFDARGFIFGPPVALALGIPFVMIRKAGKLPGVLVSSGKYITEYSTDETVIRLGSVRKGDRVVLVDDLIATGGTALAGFDLVDALGAEVYEFAAMVALPFLDGVGKIHAYKDGKFKGVPCFTLVDNETIGPEMCRDPPEGTARVVPAEDAEKVAATLP